MKRRNADTGKLRRPIKRTKIVEGMYGNPMLYVKFILLWSSIGLADYMLEFRFEFLWPLWLMIKAIYQCYQCKGLAYTVFFTCVAVTTDMVCYFYIPMQMLTYLAGVYVWVNSIWSTFESKGVCAQTVAMWLLMVYAEALRTGVIGAALSGALTHDADDWGAKPWAAGALGFPLVTLGVSVKELVDDKLRLRTQRLVREQNEFYFRLMREAIPEGGLSSSTYSSDLLGGDTRGGSAGEVRQNGSAGKRRWKPDTNGHCVRDKEHISLQAKLEHLERYVERKNRARDSSSQSTLSQKSSNSGQSLHTSVQSSTQASPHAGHTNGFAKGPGCPADDTNHCKGGTKSTKYDKKEANSLKEDRRRKKNRDLDKEIFDSHKNKEHTKEQIDKDLESTKECVKVKECNNIHKEEEKRQEERKREKEEERKREEERKKEKEEERKREREEERKREKEREKELKEREKERERERERKRELVSARECAEELAQLRTALALSQKNEAESARQLSACLAADKQRRASHADLKQQLQHKMSTWRCGERAALEKKLGEERRLRLAAEQQLLKARRVPHGECESEWCKSRRAAADTEAAALRKDLQRTRDRLAHAQRDLNQTNEQVAVLEAEKGVGSAAAGGEAWGELRARAAHLQHVLSAETRLKLELLAALGDANRKVHIHQSVINRQEKELEELKAQMLAVMPADFPSSPSAVSKMRLSGGSPLDPNATVYTPKQLCSDA